LKRLLVTIALVAIAACSAGPPFSARVISTRNTIGTGEQRILVELRDGDGVLLALDAVPNATLRDENGSPLGVYPGELIWVVPDDQPAYAFVVEIPEPETYQLTIDGGPLGETPPAGLIAVEAPIQVVAGEAAPPIEGQSITGPLAVVFASPQRCPSQSCMPMIALVGPLADDEGISFEVVDVFANPDAADEADLELSPDVEEWGLISQPWLYVIDASGSVTAVFEGAVSEAEVANAIGSVGS
jgi:hypothetical protein